MTDSMRYYCKDLATLKEGACVTVFGWVHRRRDHGGIVFIDLRDRTGILQVLANPDQEEAYKVIDQLRSEYIVKVEGNIRIRPDGKDNNNLDTGSIELVATHIEVLSAAATAPIVVNNEDEINDELVRLTYRYLDLRRRKMLNNLQFRSNVNRFLRDYCYDNGFLEVETPNLTSSTPEGARDFLIPSRLNNGAFYALPQSPQLYKQLLMSSGVDRYFQIARCYRDEDSRSDRQPELLS